MSKTSKYDPFRDTVGKIYRDLHLQSNPTPIQIGDMSNEVMKGFVEDINDAIREGTKDFNGRPFYVMIHEKKDLQMKDALLRRVFKQTWRPWPEDDTTVFWHDPAGFVTCFCWSLPHWTEMDNILNNRWLFDARMIEEITSWKTYDLHIFGFMKDDMGNWIANPAFKDKPIEHFRKSA